MDEHTAESLLDDLLPDRLDWREKVDRYPRASVAVAAAIGFLAGRRYGLGLFATLLAAAGGQLVEALGGRRD